ncbi:MAG: FecR domain-containing protein [Nitratireductor sp.]|jgi:hypothetical protein|nr:FecR domain-containing protein [Nitratireductor sp.]
MTRKHFFGAFFLALMSTAGAQAAEQVGTAVAAATLVTGSGPAGERQINKNSPIFQDDRLSATNTGNAQIILVDETRIVVGPGAQIDVDDFVYESDKTFSTVTVRATQGAFRFISGKSKSAAYRIETPYGSIGVRGTAFDVGISNGQVHVAMVSGTTELCSTSGQCQELTGLCSYGIMDANSVEVQGSLRTKNQAEKANFPLMVNQRNLQNQFRLGGGCASSAAAPFFRNENDGERNFAPENNSAGEPGTPGNKSNGENNNGENGEYNNGEYNNGEYSNGEYNGGL